MPETGRVIVTNTTPLIALAVATGELDILRVLYERVIVPFEVDQELHAAGSEAPGTAAYDRAQWLERLPQPVRLAPYLGNVLDPGEAAVVQTALDEGIPLVCIDEAVGRRVARLSGLTLTGSIGIMVKARRQGYPIDMAHALNRMHEHGIWLSEEVKRFALSQSA